MKKIISILLSFSIVFLSVSTCISISVCADTDKTVLSKSSDSPFAYSSSEAQKYVSAHLDIYDSDNTLLFSYTPTSTYNWTYSAKGKDNLHLSDNQLKAFLMSKKTLSAYVQLMFSGFSNNNVTRGLLSALGIVTTGNSNALTDVSDKLLGNYNYIDSINYDEDTQTITMDNTSVDKLRDEIKEYYYNSIGLVRVSVTNKNPATAIDQRKSYYEYEEDYMSEYNAVAQYDYSAICSRGDIRDVLAWDSSRYEYSYSTSSGIVYLDKELNVLEPPYYHFCDFNTYDSDGYKWYIFNFRIDFNSSLKGTAYFVDKMIDSSGNFKPNYSWTDIIGGSTVTIYSSKYKYFTTFSSYSALYNFLHGDQTAYLSSKVDEVGKDITFSIKDMNENLGSKMDTLIDSINSGKGNMSADELQNAIDKGLDDLNKNTEDIKDNTSDILEVLKEQNQILLDILGVTKHIADSVDDIDENANFSSLMSLLSTVFLGIQNAILYGQNTMNSDNSTDAQAVMYDEDEIVVYSSGGGTSLDYRGGIFGHFPFSVIYHLYDWLKVLQTESKCPEFSYNYGFMIGRKDDAECQITFDLSQYESWRDVISSFMKLSFTLAVAVGTYKKFKGGDLS